MYKLITFIASLYLLIELLSRTTQGSDGKVRFERVPPIFRLIRGILYTPAKSSVVEVEVKVKDVAEDETISL